MDIEKIKYEFGDDIEIFSELVDDFKIESKKMIADIEKFISDKEYHQLMIVAHTYKGVVANFYSNEIEECAFKLKKWEERKTSLMHKTYLSSLLN